jgi:hypothetical protein
MEISSIFAQAGGTAGILAIAIAIYKTVNHTRCRSKCCGRSASMSIDVDRTTVSPNVETAFNINTQPPIIAVVK